MSPPEKLANPGPAADDLPAAEANLGKVLVLIHRALAQLDEPGRAAEVQWALHRASAFLNLGRLAHAQEMGVAVGSAAQTSVDSEIVAVIAAAITALVGRPYKLVSVQPSAVTVPSASAWAIEGRTQIFLSHKIR